MKTSSRLPLPICALLASALVASADIKIVTNHNTNEDATKAFKFKDVPPPSRTDAASDAKFAIVDGEADENGGNLSALHDGKVPIEEDQPAENFFFAQGTSGGRILVDLGSAIEIKQVNTYSWHPGSRGPQVYQLYASDGAADAFNARPKHGIDPEKTGWKLIAKIDTRPKQGEERGGQYGISISDSDGTIGKYRYLLFDCSQTESDDDFGNTFYSEIDVIDKNATNAAPLASDSASTSTAASESTPYVIHSPDGKCEITIDTSRAPDLKDWAEHKLAPVLAEWYPKIVEMLPSEGYTAPTHFSINIRPGQGVAATAGTRVTANSAWLKGELSGQAIGSLLHEEVHVIQQYGRARRSNPNATRSPGWLVEGIPDYIRFFKYEPEVHGAEISKRGLARARYDGSYRVTANFLNWVVEKYDKDLIRQLNAAMRQGKYTADLWKENTGKTVEDLGAEWKQELERKLNLPGNTGNSQTNNPA